MKSRNRRLEDLYLLLRSLLFGCVRPFTMTYSAGDISGISIKSILVIRLDRIGDMVMTTPVFRALKNRWPDARITVLTNPVNRDIVINNPFIDCILVYDRHNMHRCVKDKLLFFRDVRDRDFDLVIDPYLDYELHTSFITRFAGKRLRLGFEYAGRGVFYNIRYRSKVFPVPSEKKHMVDYYMDLIACLGIETPKRQPEIFLSKNEKKSALEILRKTGMNLKNRIVGIHPGGHYESQRWLIERFAALSDYLISNYGINVIVFAGQEEKHLISDFKDYAVNTPVILQELGLREFMSVLSCCCLFLCNNSGPLHIATALNIPTVSTMGPTVPYHWWPRGDNHIVLRREMDCSPCKKGICRTHECMKMIETKDFRMAVDAQLKRLNSPDSGEGSSIDRIPNLL